MRILISYMITHCSYFILMLKLGERKKIRPQNVEHSSAIIYNRASASNTLPAALRHWNKLIRCVQQTHPDLISWFYGLSRSTAIRDNIQNKWYHGHQKIRLKYCGRYKQIVIMNCLQVQCIRFRSSRLTALNENVEKYKSQVIYIGTREYGESAIIMFIQVRSRDIIYNASAV